MRIRRRLCAEVPVGADIAVTALPDGRPLVLSGGGALVWSLIPTEDFELADLVAAVADLAGAVIEDTAPHAHSAVKALAHEGLVDLTD